MKNQSLFQNYPQPIPIKPQNNHINQSLSSTHLKNQHPITIHSSFPITLTNQFYNNANNHQFHQPHTYIINQNIENQCNQTGRLCLGYKNIVVQHNNQKKQIRNQHYSVNRSHQDRSVGGKSKPEKKLYQRKGKNQLFYSNVIKSGKNSHQTGNVVKENQNQSVQPGQNRPFHEKRHTLNFRPQNLSKFLAHDSQNKGLSLKSSHINLKINHQKKSQPSQTLKTQYSTKITDFLQQSKQNTLKNQETLNHNEQRNISKDLSSLNMPLLSNCQTKQSTTLDTKRSQSRVKSNFWANKQALKMKTSQLANSKQIKKSIQNVIKSFTIDNFEMQDKIGKGSFGDVYLAKQKITGFVVVIKKLLKKKIIQMKLQEHLMREIKIQSYLKHRHLTSLYGFFADQTFIYLILQAMPDGSFMQLYKKKKFSQEKASMYIKQICQGLKSMHSQEIIHRDIKPQNIFLFSDYVKIGDFGCSIHTNYLRNTVIGSLAYVSPEQLKLESYDQKIDVWSLGILTYQMLTGISPYRDDIIKIAKNQIPPQLSELKFPQNIKLSEDAKDFMRKILDLDPNLRIGITQALKHKFIKKHNDQQLSYN